MSIFSKFRKKKTTQIRQYENQQEVNFMNGISYKPNPLTTLKMVAGSSIFGEPSYYRNSHDTQKYIDKLFPWAAPFTFKDEATTTDVFIKVVDKALEYDFKGTLDLAKELRQDYYMRLNPSLILVRAIMHPNRIAFTTETGAYLRNIGCDIILRPDDITNQFDLFLFFNKTKNRMPSILKRIWKQKLEGFTRYQLNKYKSKALIDLIRICHANNEIIDELMQTGKIIVADTEKTWENLRSEQNSWATIFDKTYVPHMALLRNLRNIFQSLDSNTAQLAFAKSILTQLKNGVAKGKQFPFRYYSAYNEISKMDIQFKQQVLTAIDQCVDKAVGNFPRLKGKTICLCDNSGSAWGSFNSQYGSVTVATIANLSSIITAVQSEEGHVGVFGDRLSIKKVTKSKGILAQLKETSARGKAQGQSTENGIWLFFDEAIRKKIWYDNIFIYSDMQAGHGGLYGTNAKAYANYTIKGNYIDVLKLVQVYREKVNPKANIFSVQVAGYKNSVVPENLYRTSILTGWTGKEVVFANYMRQMWDELER